MLKGFLSSIYLLLRLGVSFISTAVSHHSRHCECITVGCPWNQPRRRHINWFWWLWRSRWVTVNNTLSREDLCHQSFQQMQTSVHTHKAYIRALRHTCQSNGPITEAQREQATPQTLRVLWRPTDPWGCCALHCTSPFKDYITKYFKGTARPDPLIKPATKITEHKSCLHK